MAKKKSNRSVATTSIFKPKEVVVENAPVEHIIEVPIVSKQEISSFEKDLRIASKRSVSDHARDVDYLAKLSNDDTIPILRLPFEVDTKLNEYVQPVLVKETKKSLQDTALIYMMLQSMSFGSEWIERSINALTVPDLDSCIHWLCLYCPSQLLPPSWSENRFYFVEEREREPVNPVNPVKALKALEQKEEETHKKPLERKGKSKMSINDVSSLSLSTLEVEPKVQKGADFKTYVLKLMRSEVLRDQGMASKSAGDLKERARLGKEYSTLLAELDGLEYELRKKRVDFDGDVIKARKVLSKQSISTDITSVQMSAPINMTPPPVEEDIVIVSAIPQELPEEITPDNQHDQKEEESEGEEGLQNMFDEEKASKEPKAAKPTQTAPITIMDTGTWTGQKPHNLLSNFLRKQYGASCSYSSLKSSNENGFRSGVRIKPGKEKVPFGSVEMTRMEAADTKHSANDFVAVKALYRLSKEGFGGLMRLLPPCYVVLWQEWMDSDALKMGESEASRNARRDAFLLEWFHSNKKSQKTVVKESLKVDSGLIKSLYRHKQSSIDWNARVAEGPYLKMLKGRQTLPVYSLRSHILSLLSNHNVLVVAGMTGSGKSTQIPQFCVEFGLESSSYVNVVCCQPRRISAVSLAMRVSQEMGEAKPGGLVGFQVRLEKSVSSMTRLTFMTTGVLLRMLEGDPKLNGITHVIVDEVHERSLDSDLLLYMLRELLQVRKDLKVILMSATLDAALFSQYFESPDATVPILEVPGRTFEVQEFYLEDIVQMTRYKLDSQSEYALRSYKPATKEGFIQVKSRGHKTRMRVVWNDVALDRGDFEDVAFPDDETVSEEPVLETLPNLAHYFDETLDIVSLMSPKKVNVELIETLVLHIHSHPEYKDESGSILVFLPGFAEIRKLQDILESYGFLWVLPLHGSLDGSEQARVFESAPKGMRKVVLSTNVAETGVTIPDAVFVIDSVRAKEVSYDDKRKVTRLREIFVSKANCKQRRGRAGRVKPGFCFHLIPKESFENLDSHRPPEMTRLPLEEVVLRIRTVLVDLKSNSLSSIFDRMPDPPPLKHVEAAIELLNKVDAMDANEHLTHVGTFLARLPIDVRLGKLLLFGVFLNCLDPILTIVASLSYGKSPFVKLFGQESLANAAHVKFKVDGSDLLSYVKVFDEFKVKTKNEVTNFCTRHFLSSSNLWGIETVREELVVSLMDSGILSNEFEKNWGINRRGMTHSRMLPSYSLNISPPIIMGILGAGLYPNLLLTDVNKVSSYTLPKLRTPNSSTPISLHKSTHPQKISRGGWYTYYSVRAHNDFKGSKKLTLMDLNRTLGTAVMILGSTRVEFLPRQKSLKLDSVVVQASPRTAALLLSFKRVVDDMIGKLVSGECVDPQIVDTLSFILQSEYAFDLK